MRNDFIGLNNFIWWMGVVEDRNDPLKLGRCRVRILGWHTEDINLLPTTSLPWAMPSFPLNNSNTYTPKESDTVFGFFIDGENGQEPVMLGVMPGIPIRTSNRQVGFNDLRTDSELSSAPKKPNEEAKPYPRILDEPTTSRLARGEALEGTIVKSKIDNNLRITNSQISYNEPYSAYRTKYPYNNAYESESGHAFEIDDTPNAERVHMYHRSGTYFEINPDGTKSEKVEKNNFTGVKEYNIEGVGKDNLTVIGGSDYKDVKGKKIYFIGEDVVFKVGGSFTVQAGKNIALQSGKNSSTLTLTNSAAAMSSLRSSVSGSALCTVSSYGITSVSSLGAVNVSAIGFCKVGAAVTSIAGVPDPTSNPVVDVLPTADPSIVEIIKDGTTTLTNLPVGFSEEQFFKLVESVGETQAVGFLESIAVNGISSFESILIDVAAYLPETAISANILADNLINFAVKGYESIFGDITLSVNESLLEALYDKVIDFFKSLPDKFSEFDFAAELQDYSDKLVSLANEIASKALRAADQALAFQINGVNNLIVNTQNALNIALNPTASFADRIQALTSIGTNVVLVREAMIALQQGEALRAFLIGQGAFALGAIQSGILQEQTTILARANEFKNLFTRDSIGKLVDSHLDALRESDEEVYQIQLAKKEQLIDYIYFKKLNGITYQAANTEVTNIKDGIDPEEARDTAIVNLQEGFKTALQEAITQNSVTNQIIKNRIEEL